MSRDARKQPMDALASDPGHCLWIGTVEPNTPAHHRVDSLGVRITHWEP